MIVLKKTGSIVSQEKSLYLRYSVLSTVRQGKSAKFGCFAWHFIPLITFVSRKKGRHYSSAVRKRVPALFCNEILEATL